MAQKARPAASDRAPREGADRLLFERNPLPMLMIDIESRRFLAANQAAVRTYGYSEAEFRAMSMFDIRPPEDRARLEAYLASRPASAASSGPTIWRHRRRMASCSTSRSSPTPSSSKAGRHAW
jgi:PAS domain S-box-containing protein